MHMQRCKHFINNNRIFSCVNSDGFILDDFPESDTLTHLMNSLNIFSKCSIAELIFNNETLLWPETKSSTAIFTAQLLTYTVKAAGRLMQQLP